MLEKNNTNEFLQQNSPDGGFLQSQQWLKFQEKVGHKIHLLEEENFAGNIIEHALPIVGKYFYIPRGPIVEGDNIEQISQIIKLAKQNNVGWVRIEPASEQLLNLIKTQIAEKIVKAPHDMQPKEIFAIDISKKEEELLAQMKSKTRYNINLAKKRGVIIKSDFSEEEKQKYIEAFLELTNEMAARQGIVAHPGNYYRKMLASLPQEMLKLYCAEYDGKIIAANLVLFFGKFATYLHGASANVHRNVMAPFLLQWQVILDAKQKGCEKYDFGGVKIKTHNASSDNDWEGITTFKVGFSPNTSATIFPGCYDIIINSRKYAVYKGLQGAKAFAVKLRKARK